MSSQGLFDPKEVLAKERTELAGERTVLAAERTFSAWIRTGLAGVGGGLGIIHFLFYQNPVYQFASIVMGEILILWGIGIIVFSYLSYIQTCKRIEQSSGYRGPRVAVGIFSLILLVFSFVFLILTLPKLMA